MQMFIVCVSPGELFAAANRKKWCTTSIENKERNKENKQKETVTKYN